MDLTPAQRRSKKLDHAAQLPWGKSNVENTIIQ
jgi:hypothetical protein